MSEANGAQHRAHEGHGGAVRLASLPGRPEIVERLETGAVGLEEVGRHRKRAQFVFLCGQRPEELGGYEGQLEVVGRCLEWFVFDYPLAELNVTAGQHWLETRGAELSEEERAAAAACLEFVIGLFEVREVGEEGFEVADLLREGQAYRVQERLVTRELERGQLLLGRLFPHSGGYVLSGMAALMDAEAAEQIRAMVREGKLDPESVLGGLDGLEIENLIGRDLEATVKGMRRGERLAKLHAFLELVAPGKVTRERLEDFLGLSDDVVELTSLLCNRFEISCRHEIDLVYTLVGRLCERGGRSK